MKTNEMQTEASALGNLSDDQLAAKHTAFQDMEELLNAKGGFFPSLRTLSARTHRERRELSRLADSYDAYQEARGDARRALRS